MAGTRLVLDVDVGPGNRHRSKSAAPSLWALLDRLGREHWPRLVRGGKDWGSEGNMASCEGAGLDYLFKLRLMKGARRLAERLMTRDEWEDAGQGWSGIEAELRLHSWSRTRRVVVLRRRLPGTVALTARAICSGPTRSRARAFGSSRFWRRRSILRSVRSPSSTGTGLTRRTASTS